MTVRIPAVSSPAEVRRWALLPERLHTNKPGFIPALRSTALAAMNHRRNPLHRHAHISHLLAIRDGMDVGRVSTTVHPAYNERHGTSAGFFGFLDAVDDPEVYAALLDAAGTEVARHGVSTLTGPYNYWSGDQFGVLLEKHDRPTAVFQTWNPSEVAYHLERCGFTPRDEMRGYEISTAQRSAARTEVLDRADRISRALGLVSRPMNRRRIDRDAGLIRDMFASSFASSAEVLPYPDDVFADMFGQLRPLLDLDLVRFVERRGEPVGFSLTVPYLNELLAVWQGRITPIEMARLRGRLSRVSGVVVLLLGVVPGSPMGIAPVLFADTLRAVEQNGYGSVHTTWVHGTNSAMHGLLSRFAGGGPVRRWALSDRPLRQDAAA
ncbi:hypothetical protein NtRootA9_17180 [Arthrobacter sp. NtRootA9]|nr:hypothetical protein NtRootA9_17180 [Arthrobacter sp. NtRootA9]